MPEAYSFCNEDISTIAGAGAGDVTLGNTADIGNRTLQSKLTDGGSAIVIFYLDTPNGDAHDFEISRCTFTATGALLSRDSVLESSNSDALITLTSTHKCRLGATALLGSELAFNFPSAGTTLIGGAGNDSMTGIDNFLAGIGAGALLTLGQENAIGGRDAGSQLTIQHRNTFWGKDAGKTVQADDCTGVGKDCLGGTLAHTGNQNNCSGNFNGQLLGSGGENDSSGYSGGAAGTGRRNSLHGTLVTSSSGVDYTAALGYRLTAAHDSCILIGYRITTTATRQCVFGNAAYPTEGAITDFYFNGIAASGAGNPTLQACGGSGTDNQGAAINLASGKSTGSAASDNINFKTSDAVASGTAIQTLTTKGYVSGADGGLVWGSPTGGSQGAGTINAEAVHDDSVLLTDYVFEQYFLGKPLDARHADYRMETLDATLQHVKENLHLPTIIGREEWEGRKVSIGDLVTQLWETVETQFLYISELNERVKELEK